MDFVLRQKVNVKDLFAVTQEDPEGESVFR